MNTVVEIQGWITNSYHQRPKKKYGYPERYQIEVAPKNCYEVFEIERRAEEFKRLSDRFNHYDYEYEHEDEITSGDSIIFQTLREVQAHPDLECLYDEQMIGKFVRVVGHFQTHKDGNVYISYHILEPSFANIPDVVNPDEVIDETDW